MRAGMYCCIAAEAARRERRIMRYQKKSAIAYMFRNFWQLVLIALPFSVLVGVFCNFSAEGKFVADLIKGKLAMSDFVGTFVGAFTVGRFGKNWFLPIIMLVVLAFTESVYVVKISRHMRVGELSVASPAQVFGLFPTMLMYVAVTYLCAQLLSFVPVGVVLLLRSVNNVVAAGVLSLVVTFVLSVVVSYVFTALICAFPFKYCDNNPFNVALSCSARYVNKDTKFVLGFMFLYPVLRMIVAAVCGFIDNPVLTILLQTLFILFFTVYVPCVAFVKYCDYVGRERRDIGQVMFG